MLNAASVNPPLPPLCGPDEALAIADELRPLYARIAHIVPEFEWPTIAPYVKAILEAKKKRGAVILAHNYMTPDIFHTVADFVGDSLQLAQEAARSDADVIVQAGVHFMAETSKILSPEKTVLIPDLRAGCSLAASITGRDVRLLKEKYPGIPVVTYVNTTADVKAESDICCTSSNAKEIVEKIAAERGVDTVLMIPDEYLAKNIAKQTHIKIIAWHGRCEVHERFTAEDIAEYRAANPGVVVLAHPECSPEVIDASDFAGSTSGIINFVKEKHPAKVVMLTECSMSDNVAAEVQDVEFVRPCNLCPHMKRIDLANILECLETGRYEVEVDPDIAARAKQSVLAMLRLSPPKPASIAAAAE